MQCSDLNRKIKSNQPVKENVIYYSVAHFMCSICATLHGTIPAAVYTPKSIHFIELTA